MSQLEVTNHIYRNATNCILRQYGSSFPPNLSWHIILIGQKLVSYNSLLPCIDNIQLTQEHDVFHWNLHPNGEFSVPSYYEAMIQSCVPNLNKRRWKLKAPLKVKVFLWQLCRGFVLTIHSSVKHNYQGNKTCSFCHKDETIMHLFFEC